MPRFQHLWRHVIINTRNSWLHGDERSFRSRKHRIHSSGDYKKRPPPGEHLELNLYHGGKSSPEVHIEYAERAVIGRAFVAYLREKGYKVLSVAVTKFTLMHLSNFPTNFRR